MNQELSYEEAKSLASNLRTSANNVNELLNDSDSIVKKVASNWEGQAATYAIDDWNKWKKEFEEYYAMLQANVKDIEKACEDFAGAEKGMQQNFE